jgi:diamine N-acetyltransferase
MDDDKKMNGIQPVQTAAAQQVVADLARTIWREHFVPIIGQPQVDYMLERFQSAAAIAEQMRSGAEYYLIYREGRPGGYTAIIPESPPGKLMLSKLYLLRRERGQGLGRQLMDFVIEQSRKRGLAVVWLTVNRDNTKVIEWYRRRGFRVVDEMKKDIGGGFCMDDFIMERSSRTE